MVTLENLPRPVVQLVGEGGNAYSILGRANRAMKKVGWTTTQIAAFNEEAKSGDYDNLLRTVMKYCDEPEDEEDEY